MVSELDRPLAALQARIAAFAGRGEPSAILDEQALDEAAQLWQAAQSASRGEGIPVAVLQTVAFLHWYRYVTLPAGNDQHDFQVAIRLFSLLFELDPALVPQQLRALLAEGPGAADGPDQWVRQATANLERAMAVDDPVALNDAISLLRWALASSPSDHPNRAMYLSSLSRALRTRFQRAGALADLDQLIEARRQELAAVPPDHPNRAATLFNLGNALRTRFERVGALADLDQAIQAQEQATAAAPPDHPKRQAYLSNLSAAFHMRFDRTGALGDLDRAVQVGREALAVAPPDHPDRAAILTNLCAMLGKRFERTGALGDLDRAVQLGREALAVAPPDHPDRVAMMVNLGNALRFRFDRTGALGDLDRAVQVGREALAVAPPDHPDRAAILTNLCAMLGIRFERTGALGNLDRAVQVGREALAVAPPDHPDRAAILAGFGTTLWRRFGRIGALDDLDEAIDALQEAVAIAPPDHPDRSMHLHNLGNALANRFDQTGVLADLDQAVQVAGEAVAAVPPDHPSRPARLSSLGLTLDTRLWRTGALADLDQAIDAHREAVAATLPDHPSRAAYLSNLGSALQTRFERIGAPADLDQAVQVAQEAVAATPPDHPDRAIYLNNLGNALRRRFERTDSLADLDQAIDAQREAVAATPSDHPDHARYLSNLGSALRLRFEHTGAVADLDQAIDAQREAVAATPSDHPDRAGILSSLGAVLHTMFQRAGVLADLDQAIDAQREAVAATPPDHPGHAAYLSNLALTLRTRFERAGALADAEAAIGCWRTTAKTPTATVSLRLGAAAAWGRLAASLDNRWSEAADGYATAVELLPLLAWRGVARTGREQLLADWPGLAADATAAAIMAGRSGQAVELLERGRGVLWSQLLEARTDLAALRETAPELAAQLEQVRAALDDTKSPAMSDLADGMLAAVDAADRSARLRDERMRLARQWDELVEAARALPGFGDFLGSPSTPELCAAAVHGPVVVVNTSRWRCDALAVTTDGVQVLPLPALTLDTLVDQTKRYLAAVQEFASGDQGPTAQVVLEQALTSTLAWLWDAIAEPVLTALGHTQPRPTGQPWPRVWWCPTGLLSLLPLHAAGNHDPDEGAGCSVLDRVVSSYTPTLRALLRAWTSAVNGVGRPPPDQQRLLLVAMPTTPGQPHLPNVHRERKLLTSLFPRTRYTLLDGPRATRRTVSSALNLHGWVHFSCHGRQDLVDPSHGGLLLYDGMLSIIDLTSLPDQHGEFAFLSACKTHTGGVRVADEAITLAAALQYAGWQHVIATLWSVWDAAAADVAEGVYPRLVEAGRLDPQGTAEALHRAVRQLREADPYRPSRWAPFLHAGL